MTAERVKTLIASLSVITIIAKRIAESAVTLK